MEKRSETKTNVEDFAQALAELSERHYGRSGSDLLESQKKDPLARKQYARLFGVIAKQPFTFEVKRRKSLRTKSVIALRWQNEITTGPRGVVSSLPKNSEGTWQFKFLAALAKEEYPKASEEQALQCLLQDARYESRLGQHIFRAFQKYLCDSGPKAKSIHTAVDAAIKKATAKSKKRPAARTVRNATLQRSDLTADAMQIQAAALIAAAVTHVMPTALTIYAFPLIGGVAFMLLHVGLDGFCAWNAEMEKTDGRIDDEEQVNA